MAKDDLKTLKKKLEEAYDKHDALEEQIASLSKNATKKERDKLIAASNKAFSVVEDLEEKVRTAGGSEEETSPEPEKKPTPKAEDKPKKKVTKPKKKAHKKEPTPKVEEPALRDVEPTKKVKPESYNKYKDNLKWNAVDKLYKESNRDLYHVKLAEQAEEEAVAYEDEHLTDGLTEKEEMKIFSASNKIRDAGGMYGGRPAHELQDIFATANNRRKEVEKIFKQNKRDLPPKRSDEELAKDRTDYLKDKDVQTYKHISDYDKIARNKNILERTVDMTPEEKEYYGTLETQLGEVTTQLKKLGARLPDSEDSGRRRLSTEEAFMRTLESRSKYVPYQEPDKVLINPDRGILPGGISNDDRESRYWGNLKYADKDKGLNEYQKADYKKKSPDDDNILNRFVLDGFVNYLNGDSLLPNAKIGDELNRFFARIDTPLWTNVKKVTKPGWGRYGAALAEFSRDGHIGTRKFFEAVNSRLRSLDPDKLTKSKKGRENIRNLVRDTSEKIGRLDNNNEYNKFIPQYDYSNNALKTGATKWDESNKGNVPKFTKKAIEAANSKDKYKDNFENVSGSKQRLEDIMLMDTEEIQKLIKPILEPHKDRREFEDEESEKFRERLKELDAKRKEEMEKFEAGRKLQSDRAASRKKYEDTITSSDDLIDQAKKESIPRLEKLIDTKTSNKRGGAGIPRWETTLKNAEKALEKAEDQGDKEGILDARNKIERANKKLESLRSGLEKNQKDLEKVQKELEDAEKSKAEAQEALKGIDEEEKEEQRIADSRKKLEDAKN